MQQLLCFSFGVLLGIFLYWLTKTLTRKIGGRFVINQSDPLKDICTLELTEDLDEVIKHKELILKITLK